MIYGMFRYYHLSHRASRSDPLSVLVGDKIMWVVLCAYVVLSAIIIKFGSHEAVRPILDV